MEHRILSMKRYKVFGGLYRRRGDGYCETIWLLGGLVNLEEKVER